MSLSTNSNKNTASVNQGVNLPDYFSCNECEARKWDGQLCPEFQAAGRCRAAMLAAALTSGAIRIHLHVAAGALPPGGGR